MTKPKVGVENAYNMGREAYEGGLDPFDCPASILTDMEMDMWNKGYQDASGGIESIRDVDEDDGLYLEPDDLKELNFH